MLKKQYLKNKPTCKVTFSLPKEAVNGAKEVRILGEFNNWTWEQGVPMKANKAEYKASVELSAGRQYQFRYLVDGSTWVNDWAADAYLATPYGVENSVVALEDVVIAPTAKKVAPKKKAAPAKAKVAVTKAPAKKVVAKKATTKKVTVKKDDLKKIEGVGPKIAQILQDNGILTFEDLGKAKVTSLRKFLAEAGPRYKMHQPGTWPKQAKLAAKGQWEKLAKLQDELKGGK